MEFISTFDLSILQWLWVVIAAFLVGFSKAGISGLTMLVIPIIASVFGGKESTGIILPMLLIGDVFAVYYYNRHAKWEDIRKLLPWALVGIVLGVIVGSYINDRQFKTFIASIVLACLILLIYTEKKGDNLKVPEGIWFHALIGIATGFTSMIGNAAGPIFSLYLLSNSFKKNNFIGTTSWFFLIVNLSKTPLQIFFWHNISIRTIILAIILIPVITLGALLGARIVKKINEEVFRYIIIIITALAAVKLFFNI